MGEGGQVEKDKRLKTKHKREMMSEQMTGHKTQDTRHARPHRSKICLRRASRVFVEVGVDGFVLSCLGGAGWAGGVGF